MKSPLLVAVLVAVAVASACASPDARPAAANAQTARQAPPRVEPAALLPPSAFPYDFQWHQRVTARWPTGEHSFDAVLQKRSGELLLVGLSPLGLPGFVLHLRAGGEIEVENRSGRELPFEPRYVLADVERVFFPWLSGAPPAEGERSAQHGASRVIERYRAGQLRERRFERPTRGGLERVDVSYSDLQAGADVAPRVVLTNALLGYSLTIETLEQTRLAQP
jgi:hypothetical protein